MKNLLAACGLMLAQAAFAQATPAGLWKTIGDDGKTTVSLVRITEAAGAYSGRVERILEADKAAALCKECKGELHGQPIVGMQIIQDVRADADDKTSWSGGEILDPSNGKTYKVRLTVSDDGTQLKVRGYIGTPLFGRTQTWIREN